jgi:hypothetical protein
MEAYSSFSRKLTKRSITATARIIKLSNEFLFIFMQIKD